MPSAKRPPARLLDLDASASLGAAIVHLKDIDRFSPHALLVNSSSRDRRIGRPLPPAEAEAGPAGAGRRPPPPLISSTRNRGARGAGASLTLQPSSVPCPWQTI